MNKMASKLSIPAQDVRVVLLRGGKPAPIYAYENGKKTDQQATNESGEPIFRYSNVSTILGPDAHTGSMVTTTPTKYSPGIVVAPAENCVATLTISATSQEGSRFANLNLSVNAQTWQPIAGLSNAVFK